MPKVKHYDYFKFNPTKYLNGIISSLGEDEQGAFLLVCCHYWIRKCSVPFSWLKQKLSKQKHLLLVLQNEGIIKVNEAENTVNILFLDDQFNDMLGLSTVRSSAGSKGGRGKRKQVKAFAKQVKANHQQVHIYNNKDILSINNTKKTPTLEEFTAYFVENGFAKELALRAFKGYDANKDHAGNWRDSRDRVIKNWRTKCQQVWFREDNRPRVTITQPADKIIEDDKHYAKGI